MSLYWKARERMIRCLEFGDHATLEKLMKEFPEIAKNLTKQAKRQLEKKGRRKR